jgi:hypothetical protein
MLYHSFFISYQHMHDLWHHANAYTHSCIIETEPPENETAEPSEAVEPEPDVEYMVELEENRGKQLSMFLDPLKLI